MEPSDADLLRLHELARLEPDPEALPELRADLARILGWFDRLAAVDVEGVEPLVRPVHVEGVYREDEVRPPLPPEAARALAPTDEDGFFRVPRTVEEG